MLSNIYRYIGDFWSTISVQSNGYGGLSMEFYSSLQVAQEHLNLATPEKNTLTPMQLIKLTYLSHGWMLAVHNRPLLSESVEAWPYGPVLPKLYKKIKKFRSQPVMARLSDDPVVDVDALDVIRQVYKLYGHLSGLRLSTLTHEEGTPWHFTWHSRGRSGTISNDLIEGHFKTLAAE